MGIKTLTLATHAMSGKPIFVKSLGLHATVHVRWEKIDVRKISIYELKFVDGDGTAYPVVYDHCGQGHVILGDLVIDDVIDEDEVPAT